MMRMGWVPGSLLSSRCAAEANPPYPPTHPPLPLAGTLVIVLLLTGVGVAQPPALALVCQAALTALCANAPAFCATEVGVRCVCCAQHVMHCQYNMARTRVRTETQSSSSSGAPMRRLALLLRQPCTGGRPPAVPPCPRVGCTLSVVE